MTGETVEFDGCTVRAETDKALLIHIPDVGRPVWIPRSQIDRDASEVWRQWDVGLCVMSEYIAIEKELV